MKRFLPAVAALLLFSACAPKNDPYDLYVKTSVTGTVPANGIYYLGEMLPEGTTATVEDYCYGGIIPDTASATGTSLKEFTLENGILGFGDRRCECTDGACALPPQVTACADSDGGDDIHARGTIVGRYEGEDFITVATDECDSSDIVNIDEATGVAVPTGETMPGENVLEGKCLDGLTYQTEWIPCPKGCVDGACLK